MPTIIHILLFPKCFSTGKLTAIASKQDSIPSLKWQETKTKKKDSKRVAIQTNTVIASTDNTLSVGSCHQRHMLYQVQHPVAVTPLVVVPRHQLHK